MLKPLIAASLLAFAGAVLAQAPAPAEGGKPRSARFDCSKAQDPKACEEQRAKGREAAAKARAACDAKTGEARRDCMRKELCAQSKDPAACEKNAKARAEKRKARAEQHKRRMEQDQKK
jgi:Spy/CpxP family protein refolding chaperone